MNEDKFRSMLDNVLMGKRDDSFGWLFHGLHCMSSPRVYGVLSACVSSMDAGELYVEVGTYQGGSLIAALHNNDARAIGVDSFSEFVKTNSLQITTQNLKAFGVLDRVDLRDMNYQTFFAHHTGKISVYYYDGAHDYETQLGGMEAAWPYLQKGSLIVVDDCIYPEVNLAINQFVTNHIAQVQIQFAMIPHNIHEPDLFWWNGVVVLRVI